VSVGKGDGVAVGASGVNVAVAVFSAALPVTTVGMGCAAMHPDRNSEASIRSIIR
jgi:hypothetical protein